MSVIRIKSRNNVTDMLRSGNSAAWHGRRERFEAASHFVVVGRNPRGPIFIAAIDSVVQVPESGPDRYALRFKKYCELRPTEILYKEDGSSNPAITKELSEILPGLSLSEIKWKSAPVPDPSFPWSFSGDRARTIRSQREVAPLTIAEAKRGLAVGLRIPEDAITISISS